MRLKPHFLAPRSSFENYLSYAVKEHHSVSLCHTVVKVPLGCTTGQWCLVSSLLALTQPRTSVLNGTLRFFLGLQKQALGFLMQLHSKGLLLHWRYPSHLFSPGESELPVDEACPSSVTVAACLSISRKWVKKPNKMRSWKEKRLSAGLRSFLAWHNIRFVMTANSVLTLTQSLARINCLHESLLCVCLTLRKSNSTYFGVIADYTLTIVCSR